MKELLSSVNSQKEISQLESSTISVLRFVLMVLVVFVHAPRVEYGGGSHILSVVFSQGIACMAVPLFFIISGYLFCRGLQDGWRWDLYVEKLKNRFYSLFVPYILWNLISAIYLVLPCFLGLNHDGWDGVKNWIVQHDGVWGVLWGIPINYPLWFLRDLMVMVVISPLLYYLIKWTRGWVLLCYFAVYLYEGTPLVPGFAPESFLYFSIGLFLFMRGKSLLCFPRNSVIVSIILFCLLLVLETYFFVEENKNISLLVRKIMEIPGCIVLLYVISALLTKQIISPNPFLTKASFFIFVAHIPLMRTHLFFQQGVNKFLTTLLVGRFPGGAFLYYVSNVFVVCLVCVIAYWVLMRIFPKTTSVLCGRRV